MRRVWAIAAVVVAVALAALAGAQPVQLSDGNLAGTDAAVVVGSTSKAMSVTHYGAGSAVSTDQKATCAAGLTNATYTNTGTGVFASLCGSASRTVWVERVYVAGQVAGNPETATAVITKTSTATVSPDGGTAIVDLVQSPRSWDAGAGSGCTAALARFYPTTGVTGTSVGVVGARTGVLPIANPDGGVWSGGWYYPQWYWDFRDDDETGPVVLRGTSECVTIQLGAATTGVPRWEMFFVWSEE